MAKKEEVGQRPLWFRLLAPIAGAAVLIGGVSMYGVQSAKVEQANAAGEAEVSQLKRAISEAKNEGISAEEEITSAATGMSVARKSKDDKVMKEIMTEALGWESGEQYMDARESLIERWDLDENSQFLQVFMPGEESGAWRKDPSGKIYFAYDDIISSLGSFQTSVTNIDGDKYSYFAVVGMNSKSKTGKTTSTSYATMSYTVDSQGKVSDLTGWASNGAEPTTY